MGTEETAEEGRRRWPCRGQSGLGAERGLRWRWSRQDGPGAALPAAPRAAAGSAPALR